MPLPPPQPLAPRAAADPLAELADDSGVSRSDVDDLEVDFDDSGVTSPLDALGEAFPSAGAGAASPLDASASTTGSLPEVSSDVYEIPQVGEALGTLEVREPVRQEADRTRTYQASAQQLAELARPEHTHSVAGPAPEAGGRAIELETNATPAPNSALGKRRSTGSFSPLRAITNAATTIALASALLAALAVLLLRSGRVDPAWFGMAVQPEAASTTHGASEVPDVAVASLVSVLYPRSRGAAPVLVATGELENRGTVARQNLEVVLELLDGDGQLVAAHGAPLGTRFELHELAHARAQSELDALEAERANQAALPVGARVPYMVAIAEPPGDVAELRHAIRVRERAPRPDVTPPAAPEPAAVPQAPPASLPSLVPPAPITPEPATTPGAKAKTWKMKKAWKAKRAASADPP